MTNSEPGNGSGDEERAVSLDRAIAESQRQERDERNADIARQQSADNRIVEALRTD